MKLSISIFKATIVPYFGYADIIFHTTADKYLKPLQYAQNHCLKICMKYPHLTSTDIVHKDAKVNYPSDRRFAHILNYM